jgi:glycosyltransferase involved in cell wall biosynthesis
MNILMLSTYDVWGGAAKAAARLNRGLQDIGIDARMLVQSKSSDAKDVIGTGDPLVKFLYGVRTYLGTLPVRFYPNKPVNNFTPALMPDNLAGRVLGLAPDILHLHWLGAGFMRVETLRKFQMPIVWTLHDSWAFTGGCHMPYECVRYREMCGFCPVLGSKHEADLSRWVWRRKKKVLKGLNLTLVAPSRWLAECVMSSALLRDARLEVIPNGLDVTLFKPIDKHFARDLLGLSQDKKYILFGAVNSTSDPNKGFRYLLPAIQILSAKLRQDNTELMIFGSSEPAELPPFGIKATYLGRLHEETSLAILYSAADIFVFPSVQETLGYTAMEAMACGTPCVAFRQGGVPDLIDHEQNGYLALPFEPEDLARGIEWILEDDTQREALSKAAREKVEKEFDLSIVARRYADLYRDVLGLLQ